MARRSSYQSVIVESFVPAGTSGHHGIVHIRPIPGQAFSTALVVECSKRLMDTSRYPLGTKFMVHAKLTDREGGAPFLYAYHRDPDFVLSDEQAAQFLNGKGGVS